MPDAEHEHGDPKLHALFDEFEGHLVSPGGAAHLLGVSRKTVHTLCKRGALRSYRSEERRGNKVVKGQPRWVYIPLIDVKRYAEKVGRPFPERPFGGSPLKGDA
jgi:Helix-turn-helix domain